MSKTGDVTHDTSIVERVRAAYRRIEEVDRPEVWITLRAEPDVAADAERVAAAVACNGAGGLPLAGLILAVKDNIDVAGLPTTSALPSSKYQPAKSAVAVARLEAAGAVVIGKTNLDQLATGLVGTRSPYGAVRGSHDPTKVSGGSSSGSAVAVALGIVDAALGTDTAGSGRVPAAFNGIVGIKPTLGLVPTLGVVPAAPSYDTVTVFAAELAVAERVAAVMAGTDSADPASRAWSSAAPIVASPVPRIAVPRRDDLRSLTPSWSRAFARARDEVDAAGASICEVDISALLDAARLLYDGALVAERTFAVGDKLTPLPAGADPCVAGIILGGADCGAVELVANQQTLRMAATDARALFADVDALMMPTAPGHPSLEEVAADPIGVNSWVGTYTNFVNLLDLAALAVPAGRADDGPFGVTLVGPAFHDSALADLASRYLGAGPRDESGLSARDEHANGWRPPTIDVAVFGAHRSGQVLSWQLTNLGASMVRTMRTAPEYEFYALSTQPPKPGLVHVGEGGAAIEGEIWAIPAARVGEFLQFLARPMTVGKVITDDGEQLLGFLCEPVAIDDARNITEFGSWLRFIETLSG